jgi:membrane protease YdiL (CAAX protease family)
MTGNQPSQSRQICNRDLLLPYCLPYLAYVGIASMGSRLSHEANYLLKIGIVPLLLVWAWKWYPPLTGPKNRWASMLWGTLFGVVGLLIWCLLMVPFIDITGGKPWNTTAFFLRLFSATLIVPVFEEMLMRGYILKAAFQWDMNRKEMGIRDALDKTLEQDSIDQVAPGAWSMAAVVISTLAFTVGHLMVEWPAAIAYGVLMSFLWAFRKDLVSCMVAHGVTNLGLAAYVYSTGHWGFW